MLASLIDTLVVVTLSAGTLAAPADTVEGVHYVVYRSDGTPAQFADIVAAARNADALLIGETHDDPIAHALEFEFLKAMNETVDSNRSVTLSLEMFESDVQDIINEYLDDYISERHFKNSARPWGNYDTDYRPSVEYARENGLAVIAANAPRRYVSRVTSHGAESLSDLPASAKAYLPPLPYALASVPYREQWNALMAESMAEMQAAMDSMKTAESDPDPAMDPAMDPAVDPAVDPAADPEQYSAEDSSEDANAAALPDSSAVSAAAQPMHGSPEGMSNALDSQSLWDASMAYSIASALLDSPGTLVVHFAGGFHVETGTGIPEHLERYRPGTRKVIVAIRPHDSIREFDHDEFAGLGDFVILTDKTLPRTRR